jgi:preprotein translocase subunit SecE
MRGCNRGMARGSYLEAGGKGGNAMAERRTVPYPLAPLDTGAARPFVSAPARKRLGIRCFFATPVAEWLSWCRGVAQLARAPVSKTGGWGFETLHPCQSGAQGSGWGLGRAHLSAGPVEWYKVVFDPAKFVREVRAEVGRVTWPSRRETLVTTGLVFAMVTLAALFFFLVDQVIGLGVRALFGVGG